MTARSLVSAAATLPAQALIFLIELYRTYVSPTRLPVCRFTPTCSEYAVQSLRDHGLLHGGWLATVRLAKCAPWHPGGWDPVPERKATMKTAAEHVTGPIADPVTRPDMAAPQQRANADLAVTEQRST